MKTIQFNNLFIPESTTPNIKPPHLIDADILGKT